jgi:hypothetical protein
MVKPFPAKTQEQPKKEGEDYEEGSSFFIPPPRNKKEPVPKEPANFGPCDCKWSGLPHVARKEDE